MKKLDKGKKTGKKKENLFIKTIKKILFVIFIIVEIVAILFFIISGLMCITGDTDAAFYLYVSAGALSIGYFVLCLEGGTKTKDFDWIDEILGALGGVMEFWGFILVFSYPLIGIILLFIGGFIILHNKSVNKAVEQQRIADIQKQERQKHNGYKCPNCGMQGGHPIDQFKKSASISLLGAASEDFGKTYECANCHYKW